MLINRRHQGRDFIIFQIFAIITVFVIAFLCLFPFVMIVAGSFESEAAIYKYGYNIFPKEPTLAAYKVVFSAPKKILNAYNVTVQLTIFGTLIGLFITSLAAYVLQKPEFRYRDKISFLFYFTTIFGAGLVPFYILMTTYLHLKDTFAVQLIPGLVGAWNILLLRNFFKSVPDSIAESAKIDGANEFIIFSKLYIPISKPGLVTIALFIALSYWNSWFLARIFIESPELYPLQYVLYDIINRAKFAQQISKETGIPMPDMPTQSVKMAMAVVTTGPIVFVYPYLQKYMIKGLTIGSVKG